MKSAFFTSLLAFFLLLSFLGVRTDVAMKDPKILWSGPIAIRLATASYRAVRLENQIPLKANVDLVATIVRTRICLNLDQGRGNIRSFPEPVSLGGSDEIVANWPRIRCGQFICTDSGGDPCKPK